MAMLMTAPSPSIAPDGAPEPESAAAALLGLLAMTPASDVRSTAAEYTAPKRAASEMRVVFIAFCG